MKLSLLKALSFAAGLAMVMVLAMEEASAQGVLYGAAHGGKATPSTLYRIDPVTGTPTVVGPIMIGEGEGASPALEVTGMDADPSGRLYAAGINGAGRHVLLVVDPETGIASEVGPTGIESVVLLVPVNNREREINLANSNDLSFSSGGTLYGLFSNKPIPGIIPRIELLGPVNPLTGSASVLLPENGIVVPPPAERGAAIAFSEDDVLYRAGEILSILNVGTGEATEVAKLVFLSLQGGTPRINAMDVDPETGAMFAAVNAGFSGGGPNYLATVNTQTGEVTLIGETVTGLGALAFVPIIGEAGPVMPSGLQQYSCNVVARGRYKESSDKYKIRVKKLTENGQTKEVRILNPVSFCTPLDDAGNEIADLEPSMTCYRINEIGDSRHSRGHLRFEWRHVEVENEFGGQKLSVINHQTLCVPSDVISDEVKIKTWDRKHHHKNDKDKKDHKDKKDD